MRAVRFVALAGPLALVCGGLAMPGNATTSRPENAFSQCRDSTIRGQVQSTLDADFRGDLDRLDRLALALGNAAEHQGCAAAAHYWSGFAHWRFAMNAANDPQYPRPQIADRFRRAAAALRRSLAAAPADVEIRIALMGVVQMQPVFEERGSDEFRISITEARALAGELGAIAGDNPRYLWLRGGLHFGAPRPLGEGPDAALACYYRGLAMLRIAPKPTRGSLFPAWGEDELLMSVAYTHAYRDQPNLSLAHEFADEALKRRPYWFYLKSILMPEIERRQAAVGG